MFRHGLRATPWRMFGVAAALIPVLLRTVEEWPYVMWPLQGICVGLLAGTVVWAFDETSADIVDTLPRSLAWRTTARLGGVLLLVGWWVAMVVWTGPAYFGRAPEVALQGCAAAAATTALATWLRSRGVATPAGPIGVGVVAGSAFVALARPLEDQLPVFPYLAAEQWTTSALGWLALMCGAVVLLVGVLAEIRLRR